jgi:hypothetical protein
MLPPTTSEEVARRENVSNKVGLVRDIMDIMGDIETPKIKLKILKSLLSDTITDSEVVALIEEEIERLEAEDAQEIPSDEEFSEDEPLDLGMPSDVSVSTGDDFNFDMGVEDDTTDVSSDVEDTEPSTEDSLPSPADLDIGDLSDSTNPNLD